MKKFFVLLNLLLVIVVSLEAQKASNYTCRLDNGVNIKVENGWNQVWVSQSYATLTPADQSVPVAVNVRTLGTLTSGTSFKLLSGGKEVALKGAKPGTYTLRMSFKLSGKPGTLGFDIENVVIKPQSKTSVSITLYDYQFTIDENQASQKGVSLYESKVERYKGTPETNPECGVITFYTKGNRDKPVPPVDAKGTKAGSIKPGTYDVLITLGTPERHQKIWLENFTMKPDINYVITTNLNAGIITYAGVNKNVRALHLYPAGTADKQQGKAAPERSLEILKCDNQTLTTAAAPGTYDVLLNLGSAYEWRKSVVVQTSTRAQVK